MDLCPVLQMRLRSPEERVAQKYTKTALILERREEHCTCQEYINNDLKISWIQQQVICVQDR